MVMPSMMAKAKLKKSAMLCDLKIENTFRFAFKFDWITNSTYWLSVVDELTIKVFLSKMLKRGILIIKKIKDCIAQQSAIADRSMQRVQISRSQISTDKRETTASILRGNLS